MAELFRRWKKELNKFVENNETPEFKGRYENIRDHWPAFMAHKTSEKSKKMSATNKQNAAKKKLTIARGQVATSKPGLSGPRRRMICLKRDRTRDNEMDKLLPDLVLRG